MDMLTISWMLLGGLIGFSAAQKKGFSQVGGVIGGVLLGPLAFLMFFISGVSGGDSGRRKCQHCDEWIQPKAVVCKHCHRDVAAA